MSLRGVSRVSAPQLECSGLYSAGDSLFPFFFFFFLGVTTMRVALVFFFFFFFFFCVCLCVLLSSYRMF